MKRKLFTVLQYLLFFGLGVFLVWWSVHKMTEAQWQACKEALRTARFSLIIPVFLIITASHFIRAVRWRILMAPLGYRPGLFNTFCAVMVGYLANLAIPRLGEVLKCTILARYEKVPADKLVGTILVERAVDVVSLGLVFLITLLTHFDMLGQFANETIRGNFMKNGWSGLALKLGLFLLILAGCLLLMRWLLRRFHHLNAVRRMRNLAQGVKDGLTSIAKLKNKGLFILYSLLIWTCYLGGTYLGFHATKGTDWLPVMAGFPVLAFASIGMILTPGGIGAYPWFVKEVMIRYGVEEGVANANGLLQWIAQFLIILLVGFVCLTLLPWFNKRKQ